jgi:predicted Zn-ribbon and HTH transcriptional regulator
MDQSVVLYLTLDQFETLKQRLNPELLMERTLEFDGTTRARNPLDLRAGSTCPRCGQRFRANVPAPVLCPRCKQPTTI